MSECPKDCLCCANSFSEQSNEGNDLLLCMVRDEEVVEENYCCEDNN